MRSATAAVAPTVAVAKTDALEPRLCRSENGEIVVKDQMQSEYWHIRYYSLLY